MDTLCDEDFQVLLEMAEEAENAECTVRTPCDVGEQKDPVDLPMEKTIAPEISSFHIAEEEDFNLLLEMAAQAEAAGRSDQNMLPATRDPATIETGASVGINLAPGSPGTKRKASASLPAAKRARFSSDAEHKGSPDVAMTAADSKPERVRPSSAAFQPVSGSFGRGTTAHLNPTPGSAKPLSNEKIMEKHSGLRMKNPVFPSIVFGERVSHLQFLRLPRARERVSAADSAGPWATVGVLVEKSKPLTSAKGSMYSVWKLSDLDGTSTTMLLFGDAHQDHFRESEGSVVAIFNAAAEADGKRGIRLKVNESSSILKLATSTDFGLCGSRRKDGSRCRNPVNMSRCHFCDYHVQSESKRITSSRGVLQDSSHAAKLNSQAEQAAQRQKKPNFAPYVPKQMTEDELAVQAVSYSSQGARHITALLKASENAPQTAAANRPGNAHRTGRRGQEGSRELPGYTGAQQAPHRPRPQLQAATAPPRAARVDPARPARAPLPPQQAPRAARSVGPAPIRLRIGADSSSARAPEQCACAQLAGAARDGDLRRPGLASGSTTAAERPAAQQAQSGRASSIVRSGAQGSSSGAARVRPSGPSLVRGPVRGAAQAERAEAGFVTLEEADIEWDAADAAALKRHIHTGGRCQRSGRGPSPDSDDEDGAGFGHARRSGVRPPEPASFAAGSSRAPCAAPCRQVAGTHPADAAKDKARKEAILKALEHVRKCGGIEAAREAAKRDQQAAARSQRDQQPADASEAGPQQPAPSTDPTAAPSSSGTAPGAKPAGRPPTGFYRSSAAAHRGGSGAATAQPKASVAKPGAHTRLEVKLGLCSRRSVKASGPSVARAKSLVVPPGTSAFAAAFGAALTEDDMKNVGTRYKETVEDEEAEKMDRLLANMQKKDELQQRAEAITHLSVSAWHCTTCDIITERRKPQCQEHVGKQVSATKRWWTCTGCNNRFTTIGVKYPTKRCPNPRCLAPNSEFKRASMGRAPKTLAGDDAPIAAREQFLPRGTEHSFALNS